MDEARGALETLIRERREDYAGLSRLIGRNPSYIQQYVKRGTPRRLAEDDRRELARYFRVPESVLGGPADARPRVVAADAGRAGLSTAELVLVPRVAVGASAGPGSLDEDAAARRAMAFDPALLRELGVGDPSSLSLIRVVGDSMRPTLADGDDILVDRADDATRLREGIYVLRDDAALMVKRLAPRPGGGIDVLSDNPDFPSWRDVERGGIKVIGRVLWAGRRLR